MLYRVRIGNTDGISWEEELAVPSNFEPVTYLRELIDNFNKEEQQKYGPSAKLRRFLGFSLSTITFSKCMFFRVTSKDARGDYNYWQCKNCGLVVRQKRGVPLPDKVCYPGKVCRVCSKEFESEKNLKRHNWKYHT